jgi:hypothetical protein
MAVFPREQFMVLHSANLFANPDKATRQVCEWLDMAHSQAPKPAYNVGVDRGAIPPLLRSRLNHYFHQDASRLANLID